MRGWSSLGQALLVAVLLVGFAALIGPASTVATFSDAETGTGSVTVADNFGGGGNNNITAGAGGPYTVNEGNSITLDGSGSTIQQGNIKSYEWTIVSGGGSLNATSGQKVTYTAPQPISSDQPVTVKLTVSDKNNPNHENANTDSDLATITVK